MKDKNVFFGQTYNFLYCSLKGEYLSLITYTLVDLTITSLSTCQFAWEHEISKTLNKLIFLIVMMIMIVKKTNMKVDVMLMLGDYNI